MSENQEPSKKLGLTDPVDKETLGRLEELENTRLQIGGQMLDLEQDKVKLLAATHRLDQQRTAIYEKILIDRGVSHTEAVEIDATTGSLRLLRRAEALAPEPEDPPPSDPPGATV